MKEECQFFCGLCKSNPDCSMNESLWCKWYVFWNKSYYCDNQIWMLKNGPV